MREQQRDGAVTRRGFLKAASGSVLASALVPAVVAPAVAAAVASPATAPLPATPRRPAAKRRYAIVGTGIRGSTMWSASALARHGDAIELVGLCDVNRKRVELVKRRLGASCPTFTDFEALLKEARPELLAVTTVDATHSGYIVRALDAGLDVITEKPMVTDETQCRAVLEAEKRSGRRLTVGFNYRFAKKHQRIKEVLLSGAIGKVTSVDFNWYLDIHHGADYFRRWHRLRGSSGSLLVHKSTHHFDLMNWWLAAAPVEVFAHGGLKVYGRNGPFRHAQCRGCPHAAKCPFFWDITKDRGLAELYVECESEDGYKRDGCVFREDVDIFDTMNVSVRYSNDVTMSYSLNAAMPFEGYRLAFNGSEGRLEIRDHDRQPWTPDRPTEIWLTRNFGKREAIDVEAVSGGHGGGDELLLAQVFAKPELPEWLALPGVRDGALSCLTGIAARKSIDERRLVRIEELVPGL
ncbi:MAG: Gfo/Idh/MocA family oxidoreductase [Planctomycetes bacterium]|nr:Gfo/Idh/MocA family oxidoreductase [Planctomycetota bacterium]